MHVRLARYRTDGDPQELAQRAEAGMLPIFKEQPGFRAYSLASSGGEVWSFTVWETPEAAEAASPVAAAWIAENMAGEIELVEAQVGELLLSTALGVNA